jgi:ABC-type transporter Mla subunit MlaD
MVVARTPLFVRSLVATQQVPSHASVPEPPPQTKEFSPDEAALLARLTERFYGSWAFKIIGGALVAAALLAGGGTLYLFSHTLSLREDLDKTEDRGKKDILASAQKVQDSITAQSGTLNTAMAALDQSRKDFADRLNTRKEEIDKIVQDFKTQSDSLRAEAVAQAIKIVQKELDSRVSDLSKGIERIASDANDRAGKIGSNITSLEQQAAALGDRVQKVGQSISDDEEVVARLGPRLQQLNNYSSRANDVSETLNSIREKEEALAKAVLEGASQAKSAKQYADLADGARQSAVSTMDSVRKQTTDEEHELGKLQERIENSWS